MISEHRVLEVRCDGCGWRMFDEYGDGPARFDDESQIPDALELYEWTVENGRHFCRTCICARTRHALKAVPNRDYRSCDCGDVYERAVTLKVAGGVL